MSFLVKLARVVGFLSVISFSTILWARSAGIDTSSDLVVDDTTFRQKSYGVFESPDGQVIDLTQVVYDEKKGKSVDITTGKIWRGAKAEVTVFSINPPLETFKDSEGNSRGVDWTSPDALVRSTLANAFSGLYTSPDKTQSVPVHPIGHVAVRVRIPGFPEIFTGMTTATDVELVKSALLNEVGLGGILTRGQPGRLNSAEELTKEFDLRNRNELYVEDFMAPGKLVKTGGNYSFITHEVSVENGKNAVAFMLEYIHRKQHLMYGSLFSRPEAGTGAGCIAFGISFLKALNIIPIGIEEDLTRQVEALARVAGIEKDYYLQLVREVPVPSSLIGLDGGHVKGKYREANIGLITLALSGLPDEIITQASKKLTADIIQNIYNRIGVLRSLVPNMEFKGFPLPARVVRFFAGMFDNGDIERKGYTWANPAIDHQYMEIRFWDNAKFNDYVQKMVIKLTTKDDSLDVKSQRMYFGIKVAKEGDGILGLRIDSRATTPRQTSVYKALDSARTYAKAFQEHQERNATFYGSRICRRAFTQ